MEQYCGSDCQRSDWPTHKLICPTLKKLPSNLQSFRDADRIIWKILESTRGNDMRVLEHLLSFAENQFGKEVVGMGSRKRSYGQGISNWKIEITIMNRIYLTLITIHEKNIALSNASRDIIILSYLERSCSLLSPWIVYFKIDGSIPINDTRHNGENDNNEIINGRNDKGIIGDFDPRDYDNILYTYTQLIFTEQRMASVTMNRNLFHVAEGHCQRCLAYSKIIVKEEKSETGLMFAALNTYAKLRTRQDNLSAAITFAEESYNLVVVAYDVSHPRVQEAADTLIDILIKKGDLFDAERYAEVTYGYLRDLHNKMDQKGADFAQGSYNLAHVVFLQNGNQVKAEQLSREALRIREQLNGPLNHSVGISSLLLARILQKQNNLGDETQALFERALLIFKKNGEPANIIAGTGYIGSFHFSLAKIQPTNDKIITQLLLAKPYFEESCRIENNLYGSNHPKSLDAESALAAFLTTLISVQNPNLQNYPDSQDSDVKPFESV
jgi:tetratricopeptide (TPR) repeat protein